MAEYIEKRHTSALLRWLYGRWRQVLIFGDLAGADGRPSATKIAAALTLSVVLYISVRTLAVSGGTVTLTICVFAVLFGRQMFGQFLERWQGKTTVTQEDTTATINATVDARRTDEYERTP